MLDRVPHYWEYQDRDLNFERLLKGDVQCWVFGPDTIQYMVLTTVKQYETGVRVLQVLAAGGIGAPYFQLMMSMFEDVGRSYGCTRVEGSGRYGWIRALKRFGVVQDNATFVYEISNERLS